MKETVPAWVKDSFSPVDQSRDMEFAAVDKRPHFTQITLRNAALLGDGGMEKLRAFFGGERLSVEALAGTQDVLIKISGLALPTSYRLLDVLPAVERMVKAGELFLGIGPFGPVSIAFSDFGHTAVLGPTGSGKSQAMKSLLTQAATHENIVCHVIDPKQVDFTGLSQL